MWDPHPPVNITNIWRRLKNHLKLGVYAINQLIGDGWKFEIPSMSAEGWDVESIAHGWEAKDSLLRHLCLCVSGIFGRPADGQHVLLRLGPHLDEA